jgi:hypothetical protein
MHRCFDALAVEGGERRSFKTKSIPTTAAKWSLLWNTDKVWILGSVFLCVQDICLLFIAQYFLPPTALTAGLASEVLRLISERTKD